MLTREDTDRWVEWAQRAYQPLPRNSGVVHPAHDPRTAHAGEYAAYQLGEINRKLDMLIALLSQRLEEREQSQPHGVERRIRLGNRDDRCADRHAVEQIRHVLVLHPEIQP